MSDLAEMHRLLSRDTCLFLHNVMRLSLRASGDAIDAGRALESSEQRALLDGFRAAGMVMDITKEERQRERLGLSPFFPRDLVRNLVEAARLMSKHTTILEKRRDKYVLEFQMRLRERMEKRLAHKDEPAAGPEGDANAADKAGMPAFRFTGDPSPEHGYEALSQLNGRYDQIKHALQEAAAAEPAEDLAMSCPDDEAEEFAEALGLGEEAQAILDKWLAGESEFDARCEALRKQAEAKIEDFLRNPAKYANQQTAPP